MAQSYNTENYWNEVAKNISKRTDTKLLAGDDDPYYKYKRQRFLKVLDTINFKDKNVLEIGSGPGGNLNYIYNKYPKKITGVDISNEMITLSRSLLKDKKIEIIKINGTDLPFDNSSFDLIFTSTVLQHNTDENKLKKLIDEISRVSCSEIVIFERIEKKIKGHESNLGRPISYYAELFSKNGFNLVATKFLSTQASYFVCGVIRKVFNVKNRKEGQSLTKLSITLEQIFLPITKIFDILIPSKRDVTLIKFKKEKM